MPGRASGKVYAFRGTCANGAVMAEGQRARGPILSAI
jgi:hypothetical protein